MAASTTTSTVEAANKDCAIAYIPIEVMEEAVTAYYGDAVTMPGEWLEQLRADIDEAVNANHDLSDSLRQQYAKQLDALERRENYFLDLAAEQGWPKDKLRTKIDTIRVERKDIEDTLSQSEQRLDCGRNIFHTALTLLETPQRAYERGNDTVRSILNKAFFVKLYVDGHKVIDHQAQEPFDVLGQAYRVYHLGHATPGSSTDSLTLVTAGQGWSKPSMVDLVGALSHPCREARRLLDLAKRWPTQPRRRPTPARPPMQTARQLREPEIDQLAAAYQRGTTVYVLAEEFGIHRATIGKHLQARGVDTRPAALDPTDIPEAAELYRTGWSLMRIAEKYHVAGDTVRRRLLDAGVQMRGPHERVR